MKTQPVQRTFEITKVCAKYFLFYRLTKHHKESLGTRIRYACEELGLVFIKLGQILSTRYDLLDRKHCEELQKLLDEVPPFSEKTMQEIFVHDFGTTPDNVFATFNPQPIASASVAQVYRARTHDGIDVAVKIKRPNVDRAISADMTIFKKLARFAQFFSSDLRHINIVYIIDQLQDWLVAEVDLVRERDNIENIITYYDNLKNKPDGEYAQSIVFPHVHRTLSRKNILTMDFIEGVPIRQWKTIENNPNYDIRASLKASLVATMRAWMNEDSLIFHGDPHPSNMLFLPHGKMALLDFGLIGYFDKKSIEQTRDLFLAVYAKDLDKSVEVSLAICNVSAEEYGDRIRNDMKTYINEARSKSLGFWFFAILKIFVKNRIPMSYHLTAFSRSQAIIDGIFQTVMPGVSTIEILGDELERALHRKIWSNVQSIDIAPIIYALSEKMKQSPEKVTEFVNTYFDDPLQFLRDIKEVVK